MNKFHVLIGIVLIGVLGMIFAFSQYATNQKQPDETTNKSQLNPLVTDTFKDVNLTPQAGSTGQNQLSQQQQVAGQQTQQPTVGVQEPLAASISATIKTSKGDIYVTLFGDKAEMTVRNFITKATSGYYNGLIYHRVEDWVIQGGDPLGNGTGGGQMPTEINDEPFVIGSLGVARGPNPQISNDSQFFITKTDASHLDKQYTNFGIVTKGMDVVNKIAIGDKILGITIEK